MPRRSPTEAAWPGPPPRLSQRLGYRLHNSRFASSPGPGGTIANLVHLDAEPAWIRLAFVNDQPQPWSLDGAAVAPTGGVGDGTTPIGRDGAPDAALWRRVFFDGGGADGSPPLEPETAAARSLDLPGNPRDPGRPVHAWSDWLPLTALPRSDGGPGFLLQVRSFSRGSSRFAASTGGPDPAIGRLHAGFWCEGDATAPDSGGASAFRRDDTLFACHGVQVIATTPGATVVGVGDSIIHSSCTTGEMSGYGVRACALVSTATRPVSYVNEGFPGRNSLGFCTNGLWAIEQFRPQVTVIQSWTRNETWTGEQADLAFARAMAVADATRRRGGVPILTTAAPSFAEVPEAEPVRDAANERVRALGRQGWPVLDVDALWGTGGTPNVYRPDYDAGDGWHPNDRASAAAAEVLASLLRRILPQG